MSYTSKGSALKAWSKCAYSIGRKFGLTLIGQLDQSREIESKSMVASLSDLSLLKEKLITGKRFFRLLSGEQDITEKTLLSEYWDTRDGRLKKHGVDLRFRYQFDEDGNKTGQAISLKINNESINDRPELEVDAETITKESLKALLEKYPDHQDIIRNALGDDILNNPEDTIGIAALNVCERTFAPIMVYFNRIGLVGSFLRALNNFSINKKRLSPIPVEKGKLEQELPPHLIKQKQDGSIQADHYYAGAKKSWVSYDVSFDHSNYYQPINKDGKLLKTNDIEVRIDPDTNKVILDSSLFEKTGEDFEVEAEARFVEAKYDKNHLSDASGREYMIFQGLERIKSLFREFVEIKDTQDSKAKRAFASFPAPQ